MRLYQKNILARCERPFLDVCTFIVNFIKDLSFSFILLFYMHNIYYATKYKRGNVGSPLFYKYNQHVASFVNG